MKYKLFIFLLLASLAISGCAVKINTGAKVAANNGGVYKTINKGDSWQQKTLIPATAGRPNSFAGLDASALAIDPSDSKALYFGSIENGLFYTYDAGDNWQMVKSLDKITINSIAINPKSKCIIYIASGNKIYKSTDCSRTWTPVYYDNDSNTKVDDIIVDFYDDKNIYAALSRGDIIKSSDGGELWQPIYRLKNDIIAIAMNPFDSRMIFAATKNSIYRSDNNGADWINLSENLKEFKNGLSFRDWTFSTSDQGLVFLAVNFGILKSADNGSTWTALDLITPEKKATINSLAVGPKNPQEIYYATNTTFYRSSDGGETWATKKLPTSRAGWKLLVDPENANVIYIGVRTIKN